MASIDWKNHWDVFKYAGVVYGLTEKEANDLYIKARLAGFEVRQGYSVMGEEWAVGREEMGALYYA